MSLLSSESLKLIFVHSSVTTARMSCCVFNRKGRMEPEDEKKGYKKMMRELRIHPVRRASDNLGN